MAPILEREEGLFTRHGLTRAICVLIVFAYIAAAIIFIILIWSIVVRQDWSPYPGVGGIGLALLGMVSLGLLLRLWRRCDRCRKGLFSNESFSMSWRGFDAHPPVRHHTARQLFGSYRVAAIFYMAISGRLRCQWCGHRNGQKPDYVVRGS